MTDVYPAPFIEITSDYGRIGRFRWCNSELLKWLSTSAAYALIFFLVDRLRLMNHRLHGHLLAALRELAYAQGLADIETSHAYFRDIPSAHADIPSAHATRYAVHYARARDLQRIRADIRALVDSPDGDQPV